MLDPLTNLSPATAGRAAEALARGEDRPCPECRGSGSVAFPDEGIVVDCAACGGTGAECVIFLAIGDV